MNKHEHATVKDIFGKNAIIHSEDFLTLSRELSNIPRCHSLPTKWSNSVGAHSLNCMFLVDFCTHHSYINPEPNANDYLMVKNYLQYHDIDETVTGDIPYYVARHVDHISDEVRHEISGNFGMDFSKISKECYQLAKLIDMVDFAISMKHELNTGVSSLYNRRRIEQCLQNALEVLESLNAVSYYKLDHLQLLEKV